MMRISDLFTRLRRAEAGVAMIEFAFAAPLFLMLLFWFIGRRISKASALQGLAEVAKMPGTLP